MPIGPGLSIERLREALGAHYVIDRELGRGGMSAVFLAQDVKHDRAVAIKVLHPELAASLGPDRFLQEIRVAARLSHPHILPLFDSGDAGGILYYVMPYVEGESLRERLDRERQLSVEESVRHGQAMASALDYANRQGIVHRDIKPENVMLYEGEAMVMDFGIAKAISSAGSTTLTQTGMMVGTPAYVSPEQASGQETLDGRSDQYSLACVLYEMLTGERPFAGANAQAVMIRRLTEPARPLRSVRATVPEGLERAVSKAMAVDAAHRFTTTGQFGVALGSGSMSTPSDTMVVPSPVVSAAKSVAVLPFTNMSSDPDNEYFTDGMAEEIINALTKVQALRVILSDDEKHRIEKARAVNLEAYEFYLRGRQSFHQLRRRSIEHARLMFDKAIAIDPTYAIAYAGLADCYSQLYAAYDAREFNLRQAEAASNKALELDPNLSEAHLARGMAVSLSKRFDEAREEFERAIELDPKSYEALYWYGRNELSQGEYEHAIVLLERAALVRPEDYVAGNFIAQALRSLGRDDEALDVSRRQAVLVEQHLELHPEDSRALIIAATIYARMGKPELGAEYAQRAMAVDPDDPRVLYNIACAFACSGRIPEALDALEGSVRNGWGDKAWVEHDSDFDSIREEPRYKALVAAM